MFKLFLMSLELDLFMTDWLFSGTGFNGALPCGLTASFEPDFQWHFPTIVAQHYCIGQEWPDGPSRYGPGPYPINIFQRKFTQR